MWVDPEFHRLFNIERIKQGYPSTMEFTRALTREKGKLEKTVKKMKQKNIEGDSYRPFF